MAYTLTFYAVAALTLASAAAVAFSRNIVHSAFSLLFTLMGVAVTYVMLSDDFMAVVQLLLYVGGILVLILFAIMLTNRIDDAGSSNLPYRRAGPVLLFVGVFAALTAAVLGTVWRSAPAPELFEPATARIGNSLLGAYLLPFEVISVLLLLGLVGAVAVARKESRTEDER
jgi:NADH-quinone oxidoreductase subunit J